LAKIKLEELCRELNRTNKEIKEKNEERLKKMELAHSEIIASLKASFLDIQKSVTAREDQKKCIADVDNLSEKLKRLSTEYENRLADLKNLVKFLIHI
jgi:hypothetical protein